jgi:hypothetical protein
MVAAEEENPRPCKDPKRSSMADLNGLVRSRPAGRKQKKAPEPFDSGASVNRC